MCKTLCLGWLILSLFLCSTIPSTAADGPNRVLNPGFEEGLGVSYLFVGGDSKDKNCRMAISTQTAHSGTQSGLLQADDFARCSIGPKSLYPVAPGDRYRVGVWVKAGPDFQMQPGTPGVVMRVTLMTGNPPQPFGDGCLFIYLNNTISQGNAPVQVTGTVSGEWRHIEAVVEVPAGADSLAPVLFFWKAKGALYVDDFELQKVDPTTPLSAMAAGASAPSAKSGPSLAIPTQAELDKIAAMLPATPQGVGRPISDRPAWEAAAKQPAFQKQLKDAEKFAQEPTPVLTDELFHQVLKTSQFGAYDWPFRKRSTRLIAFVVAEGIENKGKYLPLIEHELDAILGEESWAVPFHVLVGKLSDGVNGIDLAASARAWTVATTDYWLGDKLKPETRKRIRAELQRRIFGRYEAAVRSGRPHWWWMNAANNWNAVCNAGVTGAALTILPSPQERALFIRSAQIEMPYYIQSFTADGYCREAMSYWNYGFGNYLCLSEAVYEATHGQINMFAGDKIRRMALFPRHFEIMDGIYPAFGDSELVLRRPRTSTAGPALLRFINQRWGMGWTDLDPADTDLDMFCWHPCGDRLHAFGIFGFPLPAYDGKVALGSLASAEEAATSRLRYFFGDGNVLITRTERPGAPRLGLAIKGGNNGGPHGHNDNGTYVLVCNGETLLVDPGMEAYNVNTFSSHRFESAMLNSYGHDVPYVGKTLQKGGTESGGKIISTNFTPDKDTLTMDLTTAYAVPGLRKLLRTYVLDRTRPALEITDEADFDKPTDFGTALVTTSPSREQGPGSFLISGSTSLLRATVTADGLSISDKIEPITGHLGAVASKPMRLGVNLAAPARHVVMHTVIVPADLPATASEH